MEILVAVASSIIIFLFCEGIVRIVIINPYLEYKKLKSRAAYTLTYYADIYSNPEYFGKGVELSERNMRASEEIRKIASELRAFIELRPKRSIGIPNKEKIHEATSKLIGLSNNLHTAYNIKDDHGRGEQNQERRNKVYELLGIYNKVKY